MANQASSPHPNVWIFHGPKVDRQVWSQVLSLRTTELPFLKMPFSDPKDYFSLS